MLQEAVISTEATKSRHLGRGYKKPLDLPRPQNAKLEEKLCYVTAEAVGGRQSYVKN